MERLTDKIYEKTNDVSNLMQNVSTKYGYIEYLSADLGTVKDRLEAVVDEVWEYIEKLNEYEDLEEQRKLLKLPCAVGDTVYYRYDGIKIAPMRVEQIIIAKYGIDLLLEYCGNDKQLKSWMINIESTAFDCGIIFLTREEAEAALKRMEV